MFDREVFLLSYVFSALITIIFTVIVIIVTHFNLKNIDMVESLKNVEQYLMIIWLSMYIKLASMVMVKETKTKSTFGKTAYNGKGISACYLDNNDYYQYQVLRFYN